MKLVLAVVALALLAGCGGDEENAAVTVFAASSLSDVAPAIDPDATVVLGGSNDLAAQIRDGAEADVFLSASQAPLEELRADGVVELPVVFASNRLVVVVPADTPLNITALVDLTRAGVKLVLGAEGVPIGDYAREALASAGLEEALDRVVSLEDDVKGVLGKVSLGEADAGIVYTTDAQAAGDDVRSFPVPARYQPDVRYHAALLTPPSDAAREWVSRLLGAEGTAALDRAGFLPPP
ncbi:MAG: molybdate ABC transporter substrate-binding protein [Actinomycetota bacterium]|nr:molybdate ABC transporter substrate-binding protein [Actinomycetota bacterium]